MAKEFASKIALVKGGKDICRIIPFKPLDGVYELKMDFLENEFDVICYKLFSEEPIKWDLENSNQLEVTYHRGVNAKPLTIHLKHKTENTYRRLPLSRIQIPDVNQLFPIPILKMEIPTKASARQYNPKAYHRVINPGDCNVVEIYMTHAKMDFDLLGIKLPAVQLAFLMLSFEIYATNTITTGRQKENNIIPGGEPRRILTSVSIFNDLQIIAIHYADPSIDERLSKINVTFIENELSEAILAMMQIRYPPTSQNSIFECIYLGGATLRDVNQPTIPMLRPSIGDNNVIADSLRKGLLSDEEREKIYWHALNLRIKLRDELNYLEKELQND